MTIANERPKCQCPHRGERIQWAVEMFGYLPEEEKAIEHAPNECPGDYQVRLYRRGVQKLWLCSACTSPGDVLLTRADGLTDVAS